MPLKRGMKLLVVHPGASFSTHDVFQGFTEALKDRGHQVFDYALDGRIETSGRWLTYCWKRGGKTVDRPGPPDILYHAGEQLVARALRVMPDWVVIVSGMFVHPDVLVLMQRARIKVAMLFTESPYDDEKQERLLPWVQLAWTNERISAKRWGIGYARHGFRTSVHAPTEPDLSVPQHDVVFVGTGFQERIDLLTEVDWTGIDFALYGGWDMLGSRNGLRKYLRGSYQNNEQTAALYRRAKIGLNLYRTSIGWGRTTDKIEVAESLNPRAYELAATGCFTVSEYRDEVREVFGDAMPTFKGAAELGETVRYWLEHETDRQEIAARLPLLVQGHSWADRVVSMERDLLTVGTQLSPQTPSAMIGVGA
jgi:spore maturation protein CgeB